MLGVRLTCIVVIVVLTPLRSHTIRELGPIEELKQESKYSYEVSIAIFL